MDAALAGLLGTAIGAFAGVIGSLLAARQQNRAERTRLRAARSDELVKAERQALLHLTELLATGTHEIAWLAWAATNRPDEEFRKEIAAYDQRMKQLLPQLMAAEAGAAGLSRDAFDRIDPLVNELTELDAAVGSEAAKFKIPKPETIAGRDAGEARLKVSGSRSKPDRSPVGLSPKFAPCCASR